MSNINTSVYNFPVGLSLVLGRMGSGKTLGCYALCKTQVEKFVWATKITAEILKAENGMIMFSDLGIGSWRYTPDIVRFSNYLDINRYLNQRVIVVSNIDIERDSTMEEISWAIHHEVSQKLRNLTKVMILCHNEKFLILEHGFKGLGEEYYYPREVFSVDVKDSLESEFIAKRDILLKRGSVMVRRNT